MKDISKLSEEELTEAVNNTFNAYNVDSCYFDFANITWALAANCELMLKYVPECLEDEIEKENVKNLRVLLEVCANMFQNCDSYYRR